MKLEEILEQHKLWLQDNNTGCRANLNGAELLGADLSYKNLSHATLRRANLQNSCLRCTNLYSADLRGVNLQNSDLRDANMCDAKLYGTELLGADLRGVELPDNTFVIYGYYRDIHIHKNNIQVGYISYTAQQWRNLTDDDISKMNEEEFLEFYPTLIKLLDFYEL